VTWTLPTAVMTTAIDRHPTPPVLAHQPGTWLDPDPATAIQTWIEQTGNTGQWVQVPLSDPNAGFSAIELHLDDGTGQLSARGWVSIHLVSGEPVIGFCPAPLIAAWLAVEEYGAAAVDMRDPWWLHARFDVGPLPAQCTQAMVMEELHEGCPVGTLTNHVRGHQFWEYCASAAAGWTAA